MSVTPQLLTWTESDRSGHDRLMIVTFEIGVQQYALPIESVLEVVRLPALTPLAGAPQTVCGLLNRYGRYVPVLDSRLMLGEQGSYGINSQIIISGLAALQVDDAPQVGLLVDQVRDVQTVNRAQITTLAPGTAAPFLYGLVRRDEQSILLIDPAALLNMAPRLS